MTQRAVDANDRVFDGIRVPGLDIGDNHHVLRVALRHGERLGERLQYEVFEVERRADDDVAAVELPGNQAPLVAPLAQAVAETFDDTVALNR